MNFEGINTWKSDVEDHNKALETIIKDRQILMEQISEHLKSFFDYDTIKFSRDFKLITLKWDKDTHPIIKHENIHQLGFDWEIEAGYDDNAFRIVIVKIYPFGLEDGDYLEE